MIEEVIQQIVHYTTEAEGSIKEFTDFTKGNPVIGGMIGLWVTGVITFILKDVPRTIINKIAEFSERYLTVEVTIDSGHEAFYHFVKWYEKNKNVINSRTIRVTNGRYGYENAEVSLGYGFHWFIHNFWVFKLVRNKLESSGSEKQKEEITIKTIGFTQKRLYNLIKETLPKEEDTRNDIYVYNDGWNRVEELPNRTLESVILRKGQKQRIIDFIKNFEKSKEWYERMGISYKTGIILSGPPGTGKTSIVKALANYLKKDLCVLSCNITDGTFMKALTSTPENSIILMEDFDSINATKSREGKEKSVSFSDMITLSGMLNAIDGVFSNEGRILIATTNVIDSLDPALLRPGRFDLKEVIDYVDEDMVNRLFLKFFPDENPGIIKIKEGISAAQIENCFLEFKNEPKKAKKAIENLTKSKEKSSKMNMSDIYLNEGGGGDVPEAIIGD